MITVQFFAGLREALGTDELAVPWHPAVRSVSALRTALADRDARWSEQLGGQRLLLCAVNGEMAMPDTPLSDGDQVAFFPPVSGA